MIARALRGLPVGGVDARARRLHLRPAFTRRFADAPAGLAVEQDPGPGARVSYGSLVRVVLSAGPPPVKVPDVTGLSAASAEGALAAGGLRYAVTLVGAPGASAGAVLAQSPAAAATVPAGTTVELSVKEAARWRELSTFKGSESGASVPVRILGSRWRVSYSMSYPGVCLLLVTCLGPSAEAQNLDTRETFGSFELGEGSGLTHTFDSGPGLYRVEVSAGQDSASWSMTIEDYY